MRAFPFYRENICRNSLRVVKNLKIYHWQKKDKVRTSGTSFLYALFQKQVDTFQGLFFFKIHYIFETVLAR